MKILRGQERLTVPCDACEHRYPREEFSRLELAHLEGFDVVRCVEPVQCRERAQEKGIWRTYSG